MKIDVDTAKDQAWPAFHETLGRINVLMGANGSGKSQLLQKLVNEPEVHFGLEYQPIFIESNRNFSLPSSIPLVGTEVLETYANLENKLTDFNTQKRQHLSGRVMKAFQIMRAKEHGINGTHSLACEQWGKSDRLSAFPERAQRPLDLFGESFSAIFPDLSLKVNEHGHFQIEKDGILYRIESMSSGEKQLFGMLADFSILPSQKYVVLVDEPELNLHPALSVRFWSNIEELLPESIFLYATHDLSFCVRSSVDKIFVLGFGEVKKSDLGKSVDIRPFLGALPGIVISKKCLLVEGTEDSFDTHFYKWILNASDVSVVSAGNCHEVRMAAARSGVWSEISTGIQLAGVIDRDFHTAQSKGNLLILDFHEAESYLCHPEVGLALHQALSTEEDSLTLLDFENLIIEHAQSELLHTVAKRAAVRCSINMSASIENASLFDAKSESDVRAAFAEAASRELAKGTKLFQKNRADAIFSEQLALCQKAISEKDTWLLLQIFEGKQLLSQVAKLATNTNQKKYRSSVAKVLQVANFNHLQDLRTKLESLFIES